MKTRIQTMAAIVLACWLPSSVQAAPPVHESAFVEIGGIQQWVTITGDDADNPVVLFLHGGPGSAATPYADDIYPGWAKDFTLVQWDQRGAGRTFTKSGPVAANISVDRMVQDGIELTNYLAGHLHKKKIILVGGSWGSILGANMVHTRPDLYYAYVGQAQIVNWWENTSASYTRLLELSQAAKDQASIAALKEIGPPPWRAFSAWPKLQSVMRQYQSKLVPQPHRYNISPEYASAEERAQRRAGDESTFIRFTGLDFNGPLSHVNLNALGRDFSLPMFIVHGEEDLVAIPGVAESWLASLNAPIKQFYTVPGTGHAPTPALIDLTRKVITERIAPLTLAR